MSSAPRTERTVEPLAPGATIGFVGLGHMGLPMTKRLVDAGYDVRGFDVSEQARAAFHGETGATPVDSLAASASGARAVVLMLPNSAIVKRVLFDDGLLEALAEGTILLDMGSSVPTETRALVDPTAQRGVQLVDAPVSGGVKGARAGSLTVMVGGPDAYVEACQPLLESVGGRVLHVGDIGTGHALKALNNLLSAATLIATAEAVSAGRRFGLDPKVMIDAINTSSGRSYSTEYKFPDFVLPETYDAGFDLRLMVKDLHSALDLQHATGSPSGVSEAVLNAWERAAEVLPEGVDHTEIARWIDEGVPTAAEGPERARRS
jgi:3-hydroxyisobutyrate dehydrogenase